MNKFTTTTLTTLLVVLTLAFLFSPNLKKANKSTTIVFAEDDEKESEDDHEDENDDHEDEDKDDHEDEDQKNEDEKEHEDEKLENEMEYEKEKQENEREHEEEKLENEIEYEKEKEENEMEHEKEKLENEMEDEEDELGDLDEDDYNGILVKSTEDGFELEDEDDNKVTSSTPITLDQSTGKVVVTTPTNQQKELTVLPSDINKKVKAELPKASIEDNKLEFEGENLTYKVETNEKESFLFLFPVNLKKNFVFDAQTGELITLNRSLATRILDALSFAR